MDIRGWVRTSLIDYPERIATVLFTGGCNFRCPPCHNAPLVLHPDEQPAVPEAEVWSFLSRRAGRVDGVVLTGGEPTLQADLLPFLRSLRAQGLAVKLDTNGYRPDVLAAALAEGLLDYVAMDVKAPPEKYALLAGRPEVEVERVERSIALLQGSGIACEFRTTVVPGLLDEADIEALVRWLAGLLHRGDAESAEMLPGRERRGAGGPSGSRRVALTPSTAAVPAEGRGRGVLYVLQQFRPVGTLDPALEKVAPYPLERLQEMAKRARRWVERVGVR